MTMHRPQDLRIPTRRTIVALLAVGALTLAGCSSGDDSADDQAADEPMTTQAQESDTDPTVDDEAEVVSAEAIALLPIDADAPDGTTMITAECPETDEAAEAEDAPTADRYRSPITFAVPDTWTPMGQGSGGSGSITGTDWDLSFDDEADERITVDHDWDPLTADGEIAGPDGEPWESFDEESSKGAATTEITYDEVATVTVGDQDVDVFFRDPAQDPEELTTAVYKARIEVLEVPRSSLEVDETRVHSFVVTIEADAENPALTQDVVETIIGSYTIPECSWDALIDEQELLLQMDLNDDGDVMTAAERQQELQDQLEELQDDQEQ